MCAIITAEYGVHEGRSSYLKGQDRVALTLEEVNNDGQREVELQAEAQTVLDDLHLLSVLQTWGEPHLVGSMAMGLMVCRDIDFNVLVAHVGADTLRAAYAAMTPVVVHPRVSRLRYASQLGQFNPDGSPVEEGFYCGIHYRAETREPWKTDVWTLVPPRPEIALRDQITRELSAEMRAAILALKREVQQDARYAAAGVQSRYVYHAALEGIRTWAQFQHWLAHHGFPSIPTRD